eukprot:11221237-Lingulodinium_polyedra.AAC.1
MLFCHEDEVLSHHKEPLTLAWTFVVDSVQLRIGDPPNPFICRLRLREVPLVLHELDEPLPAHEDALLAGLRECRLLEDLLEAHPGKGPATVA